MKFILHFISLLLFFIQRTKSNDIKLPIKFCKIDPQIPSKELKKAILTLNLNDIIINENLGSQKDVGAILYQIKIIRLKMLKYQILLNTQTFADAYKDNNQFKKNIEIVKNYFEKNGVDSCSIVIEKNQQMLTENHFFICLEYTSNDGLFQQKQSFNKTLLQNYAFLLREAALQDIPMPPQNYNIQISFKEKSKPKYQKGCMTLLKSSYHINTDCDNIATNKVGSDYSNIPKCIFTYPIKNENNILEQNDQKIDPLCCFSYEYRYGFRKVLKRKYQVCSDKTDSQDLCIMNARSNLKSLLFNCYVESGLISQLQDIMSFEEAKSLLSQYSLQSLKDKIKQLPANDTSKQKLLKANTIDELLNKNQVILGSDPNSFLNSGLISNQEKEQQKVSLLKQKKESLISQYKNLVTGQDEDNASLNFKFDSSSSSSSISESSNQNQVQISQNSTFVSSTSNTDSSNSSLSTNDSPNILNGQTSLKSNSVSSTSQTSSISSSSTQSSQQASEVKLDKDILKKLEEQNYENKKLQAELSSQLGIKLKQLDEVNSQDILKVAASVDSLIQNSGLKLNFDKKTQEEMNSAIAEMYQQVYNQMGLAEQQALIDYNQEVQQKTEQDDKENIIQQSLKESIKSDDIKQKANQVIAEKINEFTKQFAKTMNDTSKSNPLLSQSVNNPKELAANFKNALLKDISQNKDDILKDSKILAKKNILDKMSNNEQKNGAESEAKQRNNDNKQNNQKKKSEASPISLQLTSSIPHDLQQDAIRLAKESQKGPYNTEKIQVQFDQPPAQFMKNQNPQNRPQTENKKAEAGGTLDQLESLFPPGKNIILLRGNKQLKKNQDKSFTYLDPDRNERVTFKVKKDNKNGLDIKQLKGDNPLKYILKNFQILDQVLSKESQKELGLLNDNFVKLDTPGLVEQYSPKKLMNKNLKNLQKILKRDELSQEQKEVQRLKKLFQQQKVQQQQIIKNNEESFKKPDLESRQKNIVTRDMSKDEVEIPEDEFSREKKIQIEDKNIYKKTEFQNQNYQTIEQNKNQSKQASQQVDMEMLKKYHEYMNQGEKNQKSQCKEDEKLNQQVIQNSDQKKDCQKQKESVQIKQQEDQNNESNQFNQNEKKISQQIESQLVNQQVKNFNKFVKNNLHEKQYQSNSNINQLQQTPGSPLIDSASSSPDSKQVNINNLNAVSSHNTINLVKEMQNNHKIYNEHQIIIQNHYVFNSTREVSLLTGGQLIPQALLLKVNLDSDCEACQLQYRNKFRQ